MRKYLFIIMAALLLVACSGDDLKGVIIDEDIGAQTFSFDEEDFKEMYEKNTGKAIPVSFEINYSTMSVYDATDQQVEDFLKTSYDLLGDDVIEKMYESFREDRDELSPGGSEGWRKVETGDRLFLDYGILENEKYMSNIYLIRK